MESEYLMQDDFKSFCECYQFSCEELKCYCSMEKALMNYFLDKRRSEGDIRDKNQIYIEWIKIYSEYFRLMYMMLKENNG